MRRTILTGIVTLCVAAAACAADPLPIIPGAVGFGINTPAGSGRHLDVAPDPGLARAIAGHWTFDDAAPKGGTLSGNATLVKRGEGQALLLKGKGSLALPNPDGYVKPGAGFTVMAWVCLHGLGGFVAENRDKDGTSWELGPTAAFGGLTRGPRLIDARVRTEMGRILDEIESGRFAREFLAGHADPDAGTEALGEREAASPLARTGRALQRRLAALELDDRE